MMHKWSDSDARARARTPCSKVFVGGLASETAERDLQVPEFRGYSLLGLGLIGLMVEDLGG